MTSKLALRALTLAGFLAASALPALAAEITPATPAPDAAIHSDSSVSTGAKMDPVAPKATKSAKKHLQSSKEKSKAHVQAAKLPPSSGDTKAETGASVQH